MDYDEEWEELMYSRYDRPDLSINEESDFLFMVVAPQDMLLSEQMLEYAQRNPEASVRDLFDYYVSISPGGYPKNLTSEELAQMKKELEEDED